MAKKCCRFCNKILVKRIKEPNFHFNSRKYCNKQCYWNHKKILLKGKKVECMIKANIGHS